jgi:hypothetical protein
MSVRKAITGCLFAALLLCGSCQLDENGKNEGEGSLVKDKRYSIVIAESLTGTASVSSKTSPAGALITLTISEGEEDTDAEPDAPAIEKYLETLVFSPAVKLSPLKDAVDKFTFVMPAKNMRIDQRGSFVTGVTSMASGGDVTFFSEGNHLYEIHTFNYINAESGQEEYTLTFTGVMPEGFDAEVLIVGGGGGGGAGYRHRDISSGPGPAGGGGGGAGGLIHEKKVLLSQETAIKVGCGGEGGYGKDDAGGTRSAHYTGSPEPTETKNLGENGYDSTFDKLIAWGGGGGGADAGGPPKGKLGGSGGGAAVMNAGGAGLQGSNGGKSSNYNSAGGGGGKGGKGANDTGRYTGANGGKSYTCDISGVPVAYSGGGATGKMGHYTSLVTYYGDGRNAPADKNTYSGGDSRMPGRNGTGGGGSGGTGFEVIDANGDIAAPAAQHNGSPWDPAWNTGLNDWASIGYQYGMGYSGGSGVVVVRFLYTPPDDPEEEPEGEDQEGDGGEENPGTEGVR